MYILNEDIETDRENATDFIWICGCAYNEKRRFSATTVTKTKEEEKKVATAAAAATVTTTTTTKPNDQLK